MTTSWPATRRATSSRAAAKARPVYTVDEDDSMQVDENEGDSTAQFEEEEDSDDDYS